MSGSVAETIDEYNQKVRTDIEPVDAYPKTVDERNAELALWTRKLEYQQVSNDKLQLQLDFFKKLMDYIWFIVIVVAIILPFPRYDTVSMNYVFSVGVFCVLMFVVKYNYLLAAQVYFLNLYTYVDSRAKGSVYQPYIIYGFVN